MRRRTAVVLAVALVGLFAATAGGAAHPEADPGHGPNVLTYHGDCLDWVNGDGPLVECLRICFGDYCTV